MKDYVFYLVWSPTGKTPPSKRHGSFMSAKWEAERLARCAPGAEFYVLKAQSRTVKNDVSTVDLVDEEELPF